ncbi:hypothetical protein EDB19DRAFT_1829978 [Suillus lakei]|nr:hypothetical protein EDB19DRAFT_1829978 [Suillus lakei]
MSCRFDNSLSPTIPKQTAALEIRESILHPIMTVPAGKIAHDVNSGKEYLHDFQRPGWFGRRLPSGGDRAEEALSHSPKLDNFNVVQFIRVAPKSEDSYGTSIHTQALVDFCLANGFEVWMEHDMWITITFPIESPYDNPCRWSWATLGYGLPDCQYTPCVDPRSLYWHGGLHQDQHVSYSHHPNVCIRTPTAIGAKFEVTQNQLAENKSTIPPLVPLKLTSPPHKLKLSYPPPQRYKQNYGFWFSDKWLTELGKHYRLPEDRLNPPPDEEFWLRGCSHLYNAVRIKSMTIEICFQPKTNGAPPEFLDIDGEVAVLSVCSDDVEEALPSQEQVDYLTEVLDRMPQWWVNIKPRKVA